MLIVTGEKELLLLIGIWKLYVTILLCISHSSSNVEGKIILEDPRAIQNTDKVRACGIRLKQEIESICSLSNVNTNGYYIPAAPSIIEPRRSSPYTHSNSESNERQQRERLRTNAVPSRVARGVIEECCRKACDRDQLVKYCASSGGTSSTTTTTTPSPSPVDHHLLKRTSSAESKEKRIGSNCLHCARNKSRRNKKTSDCAKTRGRKIRRRKARVNEEQSLILPLLLQLLWGLDIRDKSQSKQAMQMQMKNFFHPNNNNSPSPEIPLRRQKPSSGRGITARDIYQNPFSFLQPLLSPSSDATREDNFSGIQSHATVVTEGPENQMFPISTGTNAETFSL